MQIIKNRIVKSTHHTKPIVTDTLYIKDNKKKPIVIFCHGYKGYKDWGAWNLASKVFVKKSIFFVKFNFSHNGGTLENPIDFPDLEAFGNNNFIKELNDLEDIIDWVTTKPDFKNEIDINNITLIGHSRGGGIVTIKASENKKIKKLITWAGVSDYGMRFPDGEKLEGWKKQGVSYILNSRTLQQMPHLYQFYQNFKDNEERLTIKNAVSKIKIPHLIIHGENDDVVLPNEAKNLHSWNPKSELIFIDKMNHPLGCTQPWGKLVLPFHLTKVVKHSIEFILRK
ncbi:alpha/beta hydrolase fold domain-containing protein [uncultured Lutibacter sp.]|uniref:alpha/beta hydrolase family protein n=1 Tax=uncultured Lutibacter sp. TaxID=437739 RepID=UPI002621C963|nr:alpha/beta hydrolase fold domain-containing protein [uncultured Lutibacter sp.]